MFSIMSRRENHFFELGEAPTVCVQGMERRHLERLEIVAVLGFGIALLSAYIHLLGIFSKPIN